MANTFKRKIIFIGPKSGASYLEKVEKIANPTEGMVADLHGNLTTGNCTDKDVFLSTSIVFGM